MKDRSSLVKIYTGSIITADRIIAELEIAGISAISRDEFQQGIEAGFGAGVPGVIDLFVQESDLEKAKEIISAIIE